LLTGHLGIGHQILDAFELTVLTTGKQQKARQIGTENERAFVEPKCLDWDEQVLYLFLNLSSGH
jgi:hypothetical protein